MRAAALVLLTACSGTPATGDDTVDPPTAIPLACDDLADTIDLPGQLAANAHATRGAFPLVLSHGFAGFDRLGPLAYFGDAPAKLREAGFAVYVTAVEPMASTETVRGPDLVHQIGCIAQESGATQLNLVGHSQGGLDVRYVASDPATGPLVASVTSISTPHHGVAITGVMGDLMPEQLDDLVNALAELYGLVVGAPDREASVRDAMELMSAEGMVAFNAAHPDRAGVPYFSWAGRSVGTLFDTELGDAACVGAPNPAATDLIRPELAIPFAMSGGADVPNDGLVTVESARWGTFMGCLAADHLDEVGMFFQHGPDLHSGFDHVAFFTQLAESLELRGL